MKITFFEVQEDWEKERIHDQFPDSEVKIVQEPLQECNLEEEKVKDSDVICTFIYSENSKENLSKFDNLKCVVTRSTGTDHIDLEYCNENSIDVCNVGHYGENTVAEFAFSHLLNISRHVCKSIQRVSSGSYDTSGLRGFDLKGKTVGVVGFGSIGKKFAKMAKGFEMNVILYDAHPDNKREDAKEIGAHFVDFESLLSQSDVVSIHVPLIPPTKHLLNKDTINKMKDGSILINSARGEIVESEALLEALNSGKIYAAGLDCLEGENLVKEDLELIYNKNSSNEDYRVALEDHMLMHHKRSFITPHNAFNSQDALERILGTALRNISSFKFGKELPNKVN